MGAGLRNPGSLNESLLLVHLTFGTVIFMTLALTGSLLNTQYSWPLLIYSVVGSLILGIGRWYTDHALAMVVWLLSECCVLF